MRLRALLLDARPVTSRDRPTACRGPCGPLSATVHSLRTTARLPEPSGSEPHTHAPYTWHTR